MRTILDSELLTIREAQKFLNVNRNEIMDIIESGRLEAIDTGSQIRIEGRILKSFIACCCRCLEQDDLFPGDDEQDASEYEMEMISDWT